MISHNSANILFKHLKIESLVHHNIFSSMTTNLKKFSFDDDLEFNTYAR